MTNNKERGSKLPYEITVEGSLGLLAMGAVGLREWRRVRNAITKTAIDEEE